MALSSGMFLYRTAFDGVDLEFSITPHDFAGESDGLLVCSHLSPLTLRRINDRQNANAPVLRIYSRTSSSQGSCGKRAATTPSPLIVLSGHPSISLIVASDPQKSL